MSQAPDSTNQAAGAASAQPFNARHDTDGNVKGLPRELAAKGLWQPGTPLRLHLGCGEQHLPGYVNIDYSPDAHNVMKVCADHHADILRLDLLDESIDEIRLHHVFEHFSHVTAIAQLIRWQRALKPGGVLHLETPDLAGSAKTLSSDASFKVKMGVTRHLAGDQAASWAYHVDHWFPERYEQTLEALGFVQVRVTQNQWPHEPYLSNVTVIATKAQSLSEEALLQAADQLLLDSTVADAERPTWEIWCRQLRDCLRNDTSIAPANTTPELDPADADDMLSHVASQKPLNEIRDFNQRDRDHWVREQAAQIPTAAKVLDVGAGTCPYRDLFTHCDYRTHDFKQYEGVKLGGGHDYGEIDFVSDVIDIPAPDNSFDVILCTEVLEHVPEPIEALREMIRLLKPDGKLLITAPLGSGLHQLPYHFYNGSQKSFPDGAD